MKETMKELQRLIDDAKQQQEELYAEFVQLLVDDEKDLAFRTKARIDTISEYVYKIKFIIGGYVPDLV